MIDLEKAHLALRSVLESIAELPTLRAWENVDFEPSAIEPSISDEMGSTTQRLLSATASYGAIEATGLYIVKLFGIVGSGDEDIRTIVSGILAAFPLGASTTMDSGDALRIQGDGGYTISQILPIGANKSQCTLTIPWLVYSRNAATLSLTA